MIKSQKDFFSGLMFAIIGGGFAWGATNYSIGTGARMGPGYFPLLLGILLAVLGAFTVFYSLIEHTEDGDKIGTFAWRPIIYILGANVIFGILLAGLPRLGLPPMGLIAAIYALTIIASKAGDVFKFKEVFMLATFLSVLSYLAFIKLLSLQMPVWPTFITG
ncbi:MAG: tripartite tricarboxylate transporter TctB family protein [Burkholderiales bacterium]|jgi:predicted outer membrane lipoprotein|nr:tripartite tricarboxylate transporter TctB family protein [Burkholderiales bacterium]